jgi:hypothetical protein
MRSAEFEREVTQLVDDEQLGFGENTETLLETAQGLGLAETSAGA